MSIPRPGWSEIVMRYRTKNQALAQSGYRFGISKERPMMIALNIVASFIRITFFWKVGPGWRATQKARRHFPGPMGSTGPFHVHDRRTWSYMSRPPDLVFSSACWIKFSMASRTLHNVISTHLSCLFTDLFTLIIYQNYSQAMYISHIHCPRKYEPRGST